MAVFYEWDIETVDLTSSDDPNEQDIIDHNHSDDCPGIPDDPAQRLVLVRDHYDCVERLTRTWAYVTNGRLPTFFHDAYGTPQTKVPVRFQTELKRIEQ